MTNADDRPAGNVAAHSDGAARREYGMLDAGTDRKKTVLVVDDTPDNLTLMSSLLRDRYRVKIATGGAKALAIASSGDPPDLILLDIMMPEMNGYEVCRRLKADALTADVPVIFLTAKSAEEDETLGFDLGAVDYITKPISPPVVLARIETHLTIKSAHEFLKEKNQFLESTFSRYVSRRVFEQLKVTPIGELLRMERRSVSVLFCDLRGFTMLSAQCPPEDVRETVNSFLEAMVGCVEELDGTVDKFLGDGLMAIFGAPHRQEDHERRALAAAVAMQASHGLWVEVRNGCSKPAKPLGIGVASGEVLVGSIGTRSRTEFTALGHTVNLASRLCGAAAAGEILVPADTRDRMLDQNPPAGAEAFAFEGRGMMSFKNIAEAVEVFSVVPRAV